MINPPPDCHLQYMLTEESDCSSGASKDTSSTSVVLVKRILNGTDERPDTSGL
jgi:hypothetical protein